MRYLQGIILAAFIVAVMPLSAHAQLPTWDEMQAVLRKPISSPEVKQFVTRFGLDEMRKFDSGMFENFEKVPVCLLFDNNRVKRIDVSLSEGAHPTYTGELLLGLQHGDTPKDVIRRLGQPTARGKC